MSKIEFTDDLLTDHPDVDRHHKALFAIAGAFSRSDDHRAESILKVLDFLQNYVRLHFASEELAMERISYPKLDHHRTQHRIFVDRVAEVYRAAAGGEPHKGVIARLHFLFQDWFVEHIQAMDRPLADALRGSQFEEESTQVDLPTPEELAAEGVNPTKGLRVQDIHWEGDGESWMDRMKKRPFDPEGM